MKMNILKKRNIKVKLKRIRHVFAITQISRNIEKNMKVKIKKIHNTSAYLHEVFKSANIFLVC
jgi:hypothetical protein